MIIHSQILNLNPKNGIIQIPNYHNIIIQWYIIIKDIDQFIIQKLIKIRLKHAEAIKEPKYLIIKIKKVCQISN